MVAATPFTTLRRMMAAVCSWTRSAGAEVGLKDAALETRGICVPTAASEHGGTEPGGQCCYASPHPLSYADLQGI